MASPSGAAAARSPSSESPDAYGDACPVLTCQALDSLVAKCQARAAVTAQRTCSFPANQHKQVRLPPPVVAGLEELAEMLGADSAPPSGPDGGAESGPRRTIPHHRRPGAPALFLLCAQRAQHIRRQSSGARARAVRAHPCCTCAQISGWALRHSD